MVREETRCRHMGYSFWLAARVLLYAPSHRQDSTYHDLCYTSRRALAGTRNSSMGPFHEGSTTHRTMSERSYHGAATSRSLLIISYGELAVYKYILTLAMGYQLPALMTLTTHICLKTQEWWRKYIIKSYFLFNFQVVLIKHMTDRRLYYRHSNEIHVNRSTGTITVKIVLPMLVTVKTWKS